MHNYYVDIVWKANLVLLAILAVFIIFIVIYCILQDLFIAIRKNKLLNIKRRIYELFISGSDNKGEAVIDSSKLSTQEFLDVVTNRTRWAVFFNQQEQDYLKNCFVNQKNILKLERIAKKSLNKWHRIEAILALGYAQAVSALNIFEKGIFSKDLDISYASMLALGQIKTDLSARILLSFLRKNTDRAQRLASILDTFPASAADEIIKLINDKEPQVRFWALKIVCHFRPHNYKDKIISLAADEVASVRGIACQCIGEIGGKDAERVLLNALKDSSWLVRMYAVKALSVAMGDGCCKHIVALLGDNSLSVIDAVKETMIKYINSSAVYLEKILSGDDQSAKKAAVEILATSGYIKNIVKCESPYQEKMVSELIKAGAYYSIESAVRSLNDDEQIGVAHKIEKIDSDFGGQVLQKIKNGPKKV